MAATSSIVAQIKGDASNFDKSLVQATMRAKQFGKDLSGIEGGSSFGKMGAGISTRFGEANALIQLIKEGWRDVRAVVAAGSVEDDLQDKLEAVMGSAEAATERMTMWRKAASLPGVKFNVVVEADARLQALGYTAEKAKETILELANTVSKGYNPETLGSIVAMLGKIKDKGELSVKAIVGLSEEMPILAKVLRDEFGTQNAADIEDLDLTAQDFLDHLVSGLKRVSTQAKGGYDVFENIDEKFNFFIASIGAQIAHVAEMGDAGATAIRGLFDALLENDLGRVTATFERFKNVAGDAVKVSAFTPQGLLDAFRNTLDIQTGGDEVTRKAQSESPEERQKRLLEMEERRLEVAQKKLDLAKQETEVETLLNTARAKGDDEGADKLELKLALLREVPKLMEKTHASAEQAKEIVTSEVEAQQVLNSLRKDLENTPARARETAEFRIQQLRDIGLKKQADAEARSLKTEDEKQRLMKLGFSAADAARIAEARAASGDPTKTRGHLKRLTPEEAALQHAESMSPADRAKAARSGSSVGTLGVSASGRDYARINRGDPADYFSEIRDREKELQGRGRGSLTQKVRPLEAQALAAGFNPADVKILINKMDILIGVTKQGGRNPSEPIRR